MTPKETLDRIGRCLAMELRAHDGVARTFLEALFIDMRLLHADAVALCELVEALPKCFCCHTKTATHIAEWHPPRFYCDDCEADGVDEGKDELPYAAVVRRVGM